MMLAGLRAVFGESFWAPNLAITLLALAAVFLVYLTIANLSDRPTALAVVITLSASFMFYSNAQRILTDVPFTAIFFAILYCTGRSAGGSKWWIAAIAVLTAVGLLVRVPGILLIGPLGLGLLVQRRRTAGSGRLRFSGAVLLAVTGLVAAGLLATARSAADRDPEYVTVSLNRMAGGPARILSNLGGSFAKSPQVIAKLFTGQQGFWPAGVIIIFLILVGLVVVWRSGQRYVSLTATLPVLAYALLGPNMFAARYFIPLLPLFSYLATQGLCVLTTSIARRSGRRVSPAAVGLAVFIPVGCLVVCNGPKIARNGLYYSYLSHADADSYYEVLRHGKYADLMRLGGMISQSDGEGAILSSPGGSTILHYLTARRIETYCRLLDNKLHDDDFASAQDADRVIGLLDSRKDIAFFVLDVSNRSVPRRKAFFDRMGEQLNARVRNGTLEVVHTGDNHDAYALIPANR